MEPSKKPSHTPGPWTVSDERECGEKDFASVIGLADGHEGVEICRLFGGAPYRDGEGLANAELIAAAPYKNYVIAELLAALKVAYGYLGSAEREGEAEAIIEGPARVIPMMEQIQDAIALAEEELG